MHHEDGHQPHGDHEDAHETDLGGVGAAQHPQRGGGAGGGLEGEPGPLPRQLSLRRDLDVGGAAVPQSVHHAGAGLENVRA